MNELSPEIRAEVRSRHPLGLDQCMKEAQAINDRNIALKLAGKEMGLEGGAAQTGGTSKGLKKLAEMTTKNIVLPDKGDARKKEISYRRLTDAKAKEKHDKGLCFRCNERYFRVHMCKPKEKQELNLLIAHEEDDEPDDTGEVQPEEAPKVKVMEVADNVGVPLRSILRFSAKGTMKLKGVIAGKVVVMVDCGATHNFIHQRLVEELELPLSETSHYGVVVGNGTALKGKGICKSIVVVLPNG